MDLDYLKRKEYINGNMSEEEIAKKLKQYELYKLIKDPISGYNEYQFMRQDLNNFNFGFLHKKVFFLDKNKNINEGYVVNIERWFDRLYVVENNTDEKLFRGSELFLTIEELKNKIGSKNNE